jgi:hypothetical protein
MQTLLTTLRAWPVEPDVLDEMQAMPEWEEARAWGWVMPSGQLTGTGLRHAGELPRGIVPPGL